MSTFQFEVDPKKLRIDIGMPVHTGFIPHATALALAMTLRDLTAKGVDVRPISPVGSSVLIDARSGVIDLFLKGDGTHLFWIDADMYWHPRDFLRLVAFCTQVDVVGATYSQKQEPLRYMVRNARYTPNSYGFVEVDGLGLGFSVMKREVVERVVATKSTVHTNAGELPDVFEFGKTPDGHRLGEDMRFFQDIRALGYKVWMDPTINIFHVGLKHYGGDVAKAMAA